jgi:dihydroxy-acid dehydratase
MCTAYRWQILGGTSGLSIGHVSPEAASGGEIGLIKDGDIIEIDIPARSVNVVLPAGEMENRRTAEMSRGNKAFTPVSRSRVISQALKAYAGMVTSADAVP